ncbi:hypothetical protein BJ138DRAFT_1123349 [Hygrophoropsis aurantiaca]|uniref:Uncharacterized protein n=1 Tax=Hygrophoropsis aurantiaca TaxID=72124 RepID=A0ACB8AN32_9AGAM|nr:hypothetical protein BJ138DRAFT_1123349 [Hygrophoropsis aurantiaca]
MAANDTQITQTNLENEGMSVHSNQNLNGAGTRPGCDDMCNAESDDTNLELDVKSSPTPSSSPSPEAESSEQMLSRKREREVSLEPATPKTGTGSSHAADSKSPAKKGRVHLDTTVEEESERSSSYPHSRTTTSTSTSSHHPPPDSSSAPHSPRLGLGLGLGVSSSPPHEIKVRQISQGVEDISWRHPLTQDKDSQDTEQEYDDQDTNTAIVIPEDSATDKDDSTQLTDVDVPIGSVDIDVSASDMDTRLPLTRTTTIDSNVGAADGNADVDFDEALDTAPSLPHTRRTSDSDGSGASEQDKGLKRKLADRGTSQGPENGPSTSTKPITEPAKRPREHADADDNPREAKRPSPPPEDKVGTPATPAPAPAPKLGGFMAYASTASPFAAVKGQNIFTGSPATHKKPSPGPSGFPSSSPAPSPHHSIINANANVNDNSNNNVNNNTNNHSFETSSPPLSTATKRTGFEAFAGSASPFASAARSKSPIGKGLHTHHTSHGHTHTLGLGLGLNRSRSPPRRGAFATYAGGGVQAFGGLFGGAGPVSKRARAGSPGQWDRGREKESDGDRDGGGSSRSSLERGPGNSNSNSGAGRFGGVFGGLGAGILDGGASGSGSEREGDAEGDEGGDADVYAAEGGRKRFGAAASTGGTVSTFGERLRAQRDEEDRASDEERETLVEQEVLTGEEDEETIHQVRGKLYALCLQNQWKERGTGLLKINVRRSDGGGARLVMRKDAVFTVLLNVTLFSGMKAFLAQDPRYIRFSVIENGGTVHYNLRVSNTKIAQELLDEINANIPP